LTARLAISALLVLLPLPATAAGNDMPLFFAVPFYLIIYLVGCVPAAGIGFVLGSFLRPAWTVAVLLILASTLPIGAWAARDFERALVGAAISLLLLLAFSPLIGWGWHLGRKDAKRHFALKAAITNGN
jgi:hypothetical protein